MVKPLIAGTRSHSDFSECFDKDSTAPSLAPLEVSLHRSRPAGTDAEQGRHSGGMPRTLPSLALAIALLAGQNASPAESVAASAAASVAAVARVAGVAAGDGQNASSAASASAGGDSWRWPVAAPHPIARPFVAPATPYAAGHRGLDILSPDTGVSAPADGVVTFVGAVVDRGVLSIRHPGGLVSSYEPVSSPLSVGDAVSGGQPIATLEAGHCATPCLHFGVRLNGEYVSPLNYLGEIPWSVLLPTRSTAPATAATGTLVAWDSSMTLRASTSRQQRPGAPGSSITTRSRPASSLSHGRRAPADPP